MCPKDGPRKGLRTYNADGIVLCSFLFISAIVPAPIAKAGEKAIPEKNRRMHNVQIFWEKPVPIVKIAATGTESR